MPVTTFCSLPFQSSMRLLVFMYKWFRICKRVCLFCCTAICLCYHLPVFLLVCVSVLRNLFAYASFVFSLVYLSACFDDSAFKIINDAASLRSAWALECSCIWIPVCLCQRFSCCCVCLRACVLAHSHVFTLCPYACNRRQLLLCFCTPVGQIVRLYACMIELLTTVCLYAGMVLVAVPTLLCICVDAWLYVCMPLCLCFCVLC